MPDLTNRNPPLLGEFTEIPVSALAIPPTAHSLAKAHFALVQELARLAVPHYSDDATPEQHEDVADYLLRIAQAMDRHIKEVGREAQANATAVKFDRTMFQDTFVKAIDGNELFELDRAATAMREEHREMNWRASPYRNRALGGWR